MSTTLHSFKNYKYVSEFEDSDGERIEYIDDNDTDICAGNWHFIYRLFDYTKTVIGTELFISTYDFLDDAILAKNRELALLEPLLFVNALEKVIQNLINIATIENPYLEVYNEHLFEVNESVYGTFTEQKDKLLYYAEYLLSMASEGRYFVSERD